MVGGPEALEVRLPNYRLADKQKRFAVDGFASRQEALVRALEPHLFLICRQAPSRFNPNRERSPACQSIVPLWAQMGCDRAKCSSHETQCMSYGLRPLVSPSHMNSSALVTSMAPYLGIHKVACGTSFAQICIVCDVGPSGGPVGVVITFGG